MELKGTQRKLINDLISKVPEVYQSIYLGDELISRGCRDNEKERLEAIKHYFRDHQIVCDIGSNTGYFVIELAKKFKNSVFISIETNKDYANLQAKLIELNKLKNIILINGSISLDWLFRAEKSCVYFDLCLMLSVVHHLPYPKEFIAGMSRISKEMIIELASSSEKNVCGKEKSKLINDEFLYKLKKQVYELNYKSSVHTDPNKKRRFLYFKEEPYVRKTYYPYINYIQSHPKGWNENSKTYLIESNSIENTITKFPCNIKTNFKPGINIQDIVEIGAISYPYKNIALTQIIKNINFILSKTLIFDCKPWNMIFGKSGIELIDYEDTSEAKFNKKLDINLIKEFINSNFKTPIKLTLKQRLKIVLKKFKSFIRNKQ